MEALTIMDCRYRKEYILRQNLEVQHKKTAPGIQEWIPD
jgi:hypothetical protein